MKLALSLLSLTACAASLTSVDAEGLRQAQTLTLLEYMRTTGDARAAARGAFCATEGVLRRTGERPVPTGGVIVCQVAK